MTIEDFAPTWEDLEGMDYLPTHWGRLVLVYDLEGQRMCGECATELVELGEPLAAFSFRVSKRTLRCPRCHQEIPPYK